jgi:hypothetical protein
MIPDVDRHDGGFMIFVDDQPQSVFETNLVNGISMSLCAQRESTRQKKLKEAIVNTIWVRSMTSPCW